MRRVVMVIAMVTITVTSCADQGDNGAAVEPTQTPSVTTPSEDDSVDPNDPEVTAIADLASHLGVDNDEIEVITHENVTWRDGSIGCPEPGEMYTQALVDGYRILLRVEGREYAYHGAEGRAPFRCDNPDPGGPVAPHT